MSKKLKHHSSLPHEIPKGSVAYFTWVRIHFGAALCVFPFLIRYIATNRATNPESATNIPSSIIPDSNGIHPSRRDSPHHPNHPTIPRFPLCPLRSWQCPRAALGGLDPIPIPRFHHAQIAETRDNGIIKPPIIIFVCPYQAVIPVYRVNRIGNRLAA